MSEDKKAITSDELAGLIAKVEKAVGAFDGSVEKIAEFEQKFVDLDSRLEKGHAEAATEVKKLRDFLRARHGEEGARDWLMNFNDFISGIYHTRKFGKLPDHLIGKAATDFITTTDATAGYLVPEILAPGIIEMQDLYGKLYPRLTKVTVPPGRNLKLNKDAALPVATWRGTQGGAITEEATPMSFGQDILNTEFIGTYVKIANELLEQPGVNFAAVSASRMISAVVKAIELGVLQGVDTTEPSDGVLVDAGTTSDTALTANTLAGYATWLEEAVGDHDIASDTSQYMMLVTPAKKINLMAQSISATNLPGALAWGDARTGAPATLFGYEFVDHPGMTYDPTTGAAPYAALVMLKMITLAETGRFAVDINALGAGWTENESWLRVFTHCDWSLGIEAYHHYAAYA